MQTSIPSSRAPALATRLRPLGHRFRVQRRRVIVRGASGAASVNRSPSFNDALQEILIDSARKDKTSYHVHFGAGKLGMGLVLPAMERSGVSYAVIQRPSKAWSTLGNRSCLEERDTQAVGVVVNREEIVEGMKLFTDLDIDSMSDDASVTDFIECSEDGCGSLIISGDREVWEDVITQASSFTCAVGPALNTWLMPMLDWLPEREDPVERPTLYACENDHLAVQQLAKKLEKKLTVIPCMVDRICADLKVNQQDAVITVDAEKHKGSIVLLGDPYQAVSASDSFEEVDLQVPMGGETVVVPESQLVANYLYRRKLVTVNGMHTTLAFITLLAQGESALPVRCEEHKWTCPDVELITYASAGDKDKKMIWSWAVAQLLMLAWEHGRLLTLGRGEDLLVEAHGDGKDISGEELADLLLDKARETLQRFDDVVDTASRVLGGGVNNRYYTRLVPIQESMNIIRASFPQWKKDSVQSALLRRSGLSLQDVESACVELVKRAWVFAEADGLRTGINHPTNKGNPRQVLRGVADMVQGTDAALACPIGPASSITSKTAILFDFDGTLGDTELPAMEVAFWELAPYFPDASVDSLTSGHVETYIRNNAGKAFEFMVEAVERCREEAGLPSIEAVRVEGGEDPGVVAHVNKRRKRFGLPPLEETRKLGVDLLNLQKDETVMALSVLAQPCERVPEVLETLKSMGMASSIATTSGKPRVPVSVLSCGFQDFFPPEKIHSGESDFDPPRFKPDPSVYLLAAEKANAMPLNCIAVEDSTSGVGSAANAGLGLIVGYVGGSHITEEMEDAHARSLMAGDRSKNGRGADIVIRDMRDLLRIAHFFKTEVVGTREEVAGIEFPEKSLLNGMTDKFWVNA